MSGKIIAVSVIFIGITSVAYSAPLGENAAQEQLQQARQREELRQERLSFPGVKNDIDGRKISERSRNALSDVSFNVDHIILSG